MADFQLNSVGEDEEYSPRCMCCNFETSALTHRTTFHGRNIDGPTSTEYWVCELCIATGASDVPPPWKQFRWPWDRIEAKVLRAVSYVGNEVLAELRKRSSE